MTISRSNARNYLLTAALCCAGAVSGCRGASFGSFAWTEDKPAHRSAPEPASRVTSLWDKLSGNGPDRAPELNDPSKLHLSYAKLQEQWGNLVEARKSYETVLGRDPGAIEAMVGLARLDQLAGRSLEAEQTILAALQSDPQSPLANHALGQLYASRKEWSRAMPYLNTAMMAAPGETEYRYDLAVAMARSGDISGAMPHFVQTVGAAEAHYNAGFILYEQGNMAAAEQQLTQALIKQPRLEQASAVLRKIRGAAPDASMIASAPETHSRGNRGTDIAAETDEYYGQPAGYQAPLDGPRSRSVSATDASWRDTGHSPYAAAAQGAPHDGPPNRPAVRQTTYRPPAGNTAPSATSVPVTWPNAGNDTAPAAGYPAPAGADSGSPYANPPGRDIAPSYSAPAPARGTAPPGLTPEQREQWENQAQGGDYR